jgi:serine/threonine-protein kinase
MFAFKPRDSIGQYELVRELGKGGMGVVFEAEHKALGRRVAIKLLQVSALADESPLSSRFLREGRAAARVKHPHVVDVYDTGVDDGVPYLVMELVDGETLAKRIAREERLSPAAMAELLLPVASAVAELHLAGIVHRDLKPANILLARGRGREVVPKVADFGVSRLDDGTAVTERSGALGTFAYMAPEHMRAARDASAASDLYALGVIAYECVTGRRPHEATSPFELLDAVLHAPIVPPSTHVPALPPEMDDFVGRAMAREPSERFGSANELARALLPFATAEVARRWAREIGETTSTEPPLSEGTLTSTPMRPPASTGVSRGLGALGIAALTGGLVLLAVTGRGAPAAGSAPLAITATSPVLATSSSPPAPTVAPSAVVAATTPSALPLVASTAAPSPPPRRPTRPRTPAPPTRAGEQALDNGAPILDP